VRIWKRSGKLTKAQIDDVIKALRISWSETQAAIDAVAYAAVALSDDEG
jgi:hypothetical protein